LKIVSIVTSFPRFKGDILIPWIIKLIHLLKKSDIETAVYTSSYKGMKDEIYEGINVSRFRYFPIKYENLSHDMSIPEKLKQDRKYFLLVPLFMFFGAVSAFNYARKNKFDLIHVHFPFPLIIFGIVMKIVSSKPLVVSFHGSDLNMAKRNKIFRQLLKLFMKFADAAVVNSSFMAKLLQKIVPESSPVIIPMGSGLPEAQQIDIANKSEEILFVGRLIELKGCEYLLKATSKIIRKHNNIKINIVGDGPLRRNLETLSKELGIAENIIFHGYLSGEPLQKLYGKASIFVLPSIVDNRGFTEGLGTVLIEALINNCAVIAADVGGIPDIVKNGETGLLFPEKDVDSLAMSILKIIEDDELRKNLAKNGRRFVEENFSWESITDKYEAVYNSLKNGSSH